MRYKILFMGTPYIADEILKKLIADDQHDIVGVVSQPDKPSGRKRRLTPPPTKITAERYNIPVFQPDRVRRNKPFRETIIALDADFFLVVAYGQILPPSVLKIPKEMPLNIHASLLPAYRGAAPIQFSLLNQDTETGVTIMRMDAGMDTGDMLLTERTQISPEDNYESLTEKLIVTANEMVPQFFEQYAAKKITPMVQDHEAATYTGMIAKHAGYLNFNAKNSDLMGKIHAFSLWPKSYFFVDGVRYNIIDADTFEYKHNKQPGLIEINKHFMHITTQDGYLNIRSIQPQTKKPTDAKSFFNGKGKGLDGIVIETPKEI